MPATGKTGIVAAGGRTPAVIYDHLVRRGEDVCLVALNQIADPTHLSAVAAKWLPLAPPGKILDYIQTQGCTKILFLGQLERWSSAMFQGPMDPLLLRLASQARSMHPDKIVAQFAEHLQSCNLQVARIQTLIPGFAASTGTQGLHAPKDQDLRHVNDLCANWKHSVEDHACRTVIITGADVTAFEEADGTDALIERFDPPLNAARSILVKLPRLDASAFLANPTIGPETVELCAQKQIAGIVFSALHTAIIDKHHAIDVADRCGLFLYGLSEVPSQP